MRSYIDNCTIIAREGETLFDFTGDSVGVFLDGYVIVPAEKYGMPLTGKEPERDCNTCAYHAQSASIDDAPGFCWPCTSSETRGGPVLPAWKPIEFRPNMVSIDYAGLEAKKEAALTALDRQIGGGHYKGLKIQPMEYSIANGLNACAHTAIKYITRKKGDKAKRLEDLDKAIHSIELYKQFIQGGVLED